jgi:hypothetical protein
MNHVSFDKTEAIAYMLDAPPKRETALNDSATAAPPTAMPRLLNVGVIRNMKKRQYRYQYGDVGFRNSTSNSPPVSSLTEPENKVFNTQVAIEKVKYGTPSDNAFFSTFVFQLHKSSTLLYFWYRYPEQIKNSGTWKQ